MPWKNGGGHTVEIAVWPADASLDDFGWRVSMARVETDGPFSVFDGVDRSLAIIEGEGLRLSIDGGSVALTRQSEPYGFAADARVRATLIAGPVLDFNVMTRRAAWTHHVARRTIATHAVIAPEGDDKLVHCVAGAVRLRAAGDAETLAAGDTCRLTRPSAPIHLDCDAECVVYVVTLTDLRHRRDA